VKDVHPQEGGAVRHFHLHVSRILSNGDVFVEKVWRADGKLLAPGEVGYHLGGFFDKV